MTSPVAVPADRVCQRALVHGLYAVTPDGLADDVLLSACRDVLSGGAQVLQYRDKTADAMRRVRQATLLRGLTRQHQRLLIINDDPVLAALVGADGVHLGDQDGDVADIRQRFPDLLIGVSCYNGLSRARDAVVHGADYVAFGAMAVSATKPAAVAASPALLTQALALDRPVVAIGGITLDNVDQWIAAGAHAVAVITALFHPVGQSRAHAAAGFAARFGPDRAQSTAAPSSLTAGPPGPTAGSPAAPVSSANPFPQEPRHEP